MRILIVEDDPAVREMTAELLRFNSHSVLTAANGEIALQRLRESAIDLVLSDIMMPVMDGVQMLLRLRADPALAMMPVMLISAYPDPRFGLPAEALEHTHFLRKPFGEEILLAAIESIRPAGG